MMLLFDATGWLSKARAGVEIECFALPFVMPSRASFSRLSSATVKLQGCISSHSFACLLCVSSYRLSDIFSTPPSRSLATQHSTKKCKVSTRQSSTHCLHGSTNSQDSFLLQYTVPCEDICYICGRVSQAGAPVVLCFKESFHSANSMACHGVP